MMRTKPRGEVGVCVIGAGPAGATLAARLAGLGHAVCLIERRTFPRRHVGESLTPGVLPLLEMTGARGIVEQAAFWPVHAVRVKWDKDLEERRDPGPSGLLVDRGHFDLLLLERARALGVRVLQPAVVHERRRSAAGWRLRVDTPNRRIELHAAFLAEATGRATMRGARRRRTGCRTLALYAYWRGESLPRVPRIEAGSDQWFWGVPLPDGSYNTLAFVDAEQFRARASTPLTAYFRTLIARSGLLTGCEAVRPASRVFAIEATPYLDDECIEPRRIRVGEAALALDPLSSSGVQNAIQSALTGAVVVNTLLRRPESGDAAQRFYRDHLGDASARHRHWAAGHYAAVAWRRDAAFWRHRAAGSQPEPPPLPPPAAPHAGARLELSPLVTFTDRPCIDGEFVAVKSVVEHPGLSRPVAFLAGWELAPLLRRLPAGLTRLEIGRYWSSRLPLDAGVTMADWLLDKGVLVRQRGEDRGSALG